MHSPTLGGYPLSLRDNDKVSSSLKNGELAYSYTNDKIYYKNKNSGEIIDIAKSIYDKLLAAKVENTKIKITKKDDEASKETSIPIIPDPDYRTFNTFYMNILKEEDQKAKN